MNVNTWSSWPPLKPNSSSSGTREFLPVQTRGNEEPGGGSVVAGGTIFVNPRPMGCTPEGLSHVSDANYALCGAITNVQVSVWPKKYLWSDPAPHFGFRYQKTNETDWVEGATGEALVAEIQCGCDLRVDWAVHGLPMNSEDPEPATLWAYTSSCGCVEAGDGYEVVRPWLVIGGAPDNVAFAALQTVTNTAQVVNYDAGLMDGKFFMEAEYRRVGHYRPGADPAYSEYNVTQVVHRVIQNGKTKWEVTSDMVYEWEWDGTTDYYFSRLEALETTDNPDNNLQPLSTYLMRTYMNRKVPGAYVDFVARLLDDEDNVIDEKSRRIYIQQVVKMEWQDRAAKAVGFAGDYPGANLVGLTNMPRATPRQQIEAGVKAYFDEQQVGAPLNVLFVDKATRLSHENDYKVLWFEYEARDRKGKRYPSTVLGTTGSQRLVHGGPTPDGESRVFIENILNVYCKDEVFPEKDVNATPFNERNGELCYSISRCGGHEIGHNLALVDKFFNQFANEDGHYEEYEDKDAFEKKFPNGMFFPSSRLMNDGGYIIFETFSGRLLINNWTDFDKAHLPAILPCPPTPNP